MQTQSSQRSEQFRSCLIESCVPLADKNWFGTGGAAQFFAQPNTVEQLQDAITYARERKLPITLLGKGANMLINDDGVRGLVIQPHLNHISFDQKSVTAQAGVCLDELIIRCLEQKLLGLEEFSGIPGTVGGAVFINLHYFQFLLSNFLIGATVLDKQTGTIEQVTADWFQFGYNQSRLHDGDHILVDASFQLRSADPQMIAYARGRRDEIIRHRQQRYPADGTCGSFFRNFYEDEVTREVNGKKMIWAAYYLDKIGVKGELSVGDAQVSHQHANMIVNRGNATSSNVIEVAKKMQQLVLNSFGIIPEPECRLVGFETYPLLKKEEQ